MYVRGFQVLAERRVNIGVVDCTFWVERYIIWRDKSDGKQKSLRRWPTGGTRQSGSPVPSPQSAVRNYRANFQSWHCRKKNFIVHYDFCCRLVILFFFSNFFFFVHPDDPLVPPPPYPAPPFQSEPSASPPPPDYPVRAAHRTHTRTHTIFR